jgi:hypothetical protein
MLAGETGLEINVSDLRPGLSGDALTIRVRRNLEFLCDVFGSHVTRWHLGVE